MAIPTDRNSLIQYCFRNLGQGALDVNVTPEQADDRVDEAIDYMTQFHFEGVHKLYVAIQATANDVANQYFIMPNNTVGVTRIFPLSTETVNSLNNHDFNMFDLNYQIRLNELYDFTSADYVYFELANEHIRTLEMLFIGDLQIDYNRYINKVYVHMDWSADVMPGSWVIFETYQQLDNNQAVKFWNDMFLKQLTTQLIKRQWGENLKLFGGTPLPGGIVVNGQQIYDEATAEIERLKALVRDTFEQPASWEVG